MLYSNAMAYFNPITFFREQFETLPVPPTRDLSDSVAIVVGSTGGIGRDLALHFAKSHARVILANRNEIRNWAAKIWIAEELPVGTVSRIECWDVDLASFESVKAFAARARKELDRVDFLCLNGKTFLLSILSLLNSSSWDNGMEVVHHSGRLRNHAPDQRPLHRPLSRPSLTLDQTNRFYSLQIRHQTAHYDHEQRSALHDFF